MDSDPEDGYHMVVAVLDDSVLLETVDGIQRKKED